MRIRFALVLMVAGLLVAAGIASAQTETTGNYTTSTPTGDYTTPVKTTTQEEAPATQGESAAAPAVAGATQTAPSNLAFTGAEPLLLVIVGLALAGGTATLLVRDRRRSTTNR